MRSVLVAAAALSAVLFAVSYPRLLERIFPGLASPYPKADIGRRFLSGMVDGLLVMTAWILFRYYESPVYLFVGLLYIVLKDSLLGRSVGKFCFGLVVIDLHTGYPCGRVSSVKRNILFLVPGLNMSAAFLELMTVVRDPQGQRLGDRLAQTQVVEGLGARDLASAFQRWWRDFLDRLERTPRRSRRYQ
jgi:uncharacterized RDD family membrane protein YckC